MSVPEGPLGELLGFFSLAFHYLEITGKYWMPIVLFSTFLITWRKYVMAHYIYSLDRVLLEVRLPREIRKTPLSMEIVLGALHQTPQGTWLDHWWKGRVRAWFSLELVSIEGHVHFFIWTQKFHQKVIEASIYAQYPEVEIVTVDDYTRYVHYGTLDSEWDLWGTEFAFTKPDPYPIKTYVDYEIDKAGAEEEEKADPMASVVEALGSLGKDEQIWFQILVRATKDERVGWFKKRSWKKEGQALVKQLRKRDIPPKPGQISIYTEKLLSPGEEKVVKGIERSIGKLGFDCGVRGIYLAKKGVFNPSNIPALIGMVKHYNAEDMNGFKPDDYTKTDFDFPWQDFRGIRIGRKKRTIFHAYRDRSYFYPPYKRKPLVLSSEELATIYHFPGGVAQTPTVFRVPSRTGEPPPDLPR